MITGPHFSLSYRMVSLHHQPIYWTGSVSIGGLSDVLFLGGGRLSSPSPGLAIRPCIRITIKTNVSQPYIQSYPHCPQHSNHAICSIVTTSTSFTPEPVDLNTACKWRAYERCPIRSVYMYTARKPGTFKLCREQGGKETAVSETGRSTAVDDRTLPPIRRGRCVELTRLYVPGSISTNVTTAILWMPPTIQPSTEFPGPGVARPVQQECKVVSNTCQSLPHVSRTYTTRSSADAEGQRDAPQIRNIALEKVCNREWPSRTLKVITTAAIW